MDKLDNQDLIAGFDKSNMLSLLKNFPEQLKDAQRIGESAEINSEYKDIKNIVFVGMGGSAIGADLLKTLLFKECKVSISVIRGYELPSYVDKTSLLFACSYSGNTEETLSCFKEAQQRDARIISISSGGKLEKLSVESGIPFVKIPAGYPPRCALGYLSITPLCILTKLGLIFDKKSDLEEAASLLTKLYKEELSPDVSGAKNKAKKLAERFFKKYVIIYGSSPYLETVVLRLRGQLAENSKHLSSSHVLPEMNHNEIVGWENPKNIFKDLLVVFLRDKDEHVRVTKRIEITDLLIKKENVEITDIHSKGVSLLARAFSLIYIGDFSSFYLALLNNIDPTPVEKVMYLKNELAKI